APAHRPGTGTAATSVLAGDPRGGAGTAVSTRRPRSGRPSTQTRAQRRPAQAPARGRRRSSRLLVTLLVLALLALGAVAAVVATAPGPTRVVLRNVVYSDVQRASTALKQLVSENTQ
ncbi:MAG TPA: hypothetical protein VED41_00145, partial [Solirubrobacteraceae bacterium]|nr:hypothetical protein [Solirubrobacteraceae bacterium]